MLDCANDMITIAYMESTNSDSAIAGNGGTSGYSDEQLCEMAKKYYEQQYGQTLPLAVVDSADADTVNIHLCEDTIQQITLQPGNGTVCRE